MPELPEVESVRRSLEPLVMGRTVRGVTVHRRDVVVLPGDPAGGFARLRARGTPVRAQRLLKRLLLVGSRIERLSRHGKQFIIETERGGPAVCVHLGMTGQVLHLAAGARAEDRTHVHVTWRLDDGSRVLFRDPRRFGGVWCYESREDLARARLAPLGPDALSITPRLLREALAGSRSPVKARLLDQRAIAGMGNIYADEALFLARIAPTREAGSLGEEEIRGLARAMREILRRAIEAGGSTLRDYRSGTGRRGEFQGRHLVYGRGGKPCRACGGELATGLIGGRTTVWCPRCQA